MLTQSDHWIFYIWSSQTEGYISVAGCPGTLNCGRPARVPGAATVISFIEQGVVSAGRAGGGVRPSSRSAAKDDACDEVSCGANILTRTDKSIK